MRIDDPAFWRAGAISTIVVMSAILVMLTADSLAAIREGGTHVPPYTVINRHIGYDFDASREMDVPSIGGVEPLFGRVLDEQAATRLMEKGKLVFQSRACLDCHTIYGNGAYFAPDLTKAWLDPDWDTWKAITGTNSREEAMVRFLKDPVQFRTWTRTMPNLHLTDEEARAIVAYLKWTSAVDTNGFPANFGHMHADQ